MGAKQGLGLCLCVLLAISQLVTGCETNEGSSSGSSIDGTPSNDSTLPTPTPTPTPVPDGTFKISINSSASLLSQTLRKAYEIDELGNSTATTNFSEECKIDPTATDVAERNIICYLEVEELDLYANGINLDVSVSENDCEYVFQFHYFYYKREAGQGANTVQLFRDPGDNTLKDCNTPVGSQNGEPFCSFDHSDIDGPNCCVGQYDVEIYSDANCTVPDGADAANATNVEWGGKLSDCLAGPGTASSVKIEDGIMEGYPLPTFTSTESASGGVTLPYNPPAPVTNRLANVNNANFFTPTVFGGAEDELNGAEATYPEGISSTAATNAVTAAGSNIYVAPYYVWACSDSGQELLGRIRLVVREWNTKNEISKGFITPLEPGYNPATAPELEGDPDVTGTDDFGSNVNDSYDWDDFKIIRGFDFPNHD